MESGNGFLMPDKMSKTNGDVDNVHPIARPAETQDHLLLQRPEPHADPEQVVALEPATLPSHPLRAMDVPCFLPKLIG